MTSKAAVFSVSWSNQGCPRNADDTAEAYWMGLLRSAEAEAFARHCEGCPACQRISAEAHEFVDALQRSNLGSQINILKCVKNAISESQTGRNYTDLPYQSPNDMDFRASLEKLRAERALLDAAIAELDRAGDPVPPARKSRLFLVPRAGA